MAQTDQWPAESPASSGTRRAPRIGRELKPLLERNDQVEIGELEQRVGLLGGDRGDQAARSFREIFGDLR